MSTGRSERPSNQTLPRPAYADDMARIILFIVAAVVVIVLLWVLLWNFLHLLILGFAVVLLAALGFGLFRVGRWSAAKRS